MSDLTIILLGKTAPETSRVGNFILGRDVFKTEAPPPSVEHHSERVRGHVEERCITLINTYNFFDTELTQDVLDHKLEECVSLSSPGPHAFLFVIEPITFTVKDSTRMRHILDSFGEQAQKYAIVITTNREVTLYTKKKRESFQKIVNECNLRQHVLISTTTKNIYLVRNLLKEIDSMVRQNGGTYFICETYEDAQEDDKPEAHAIEKMDDFTENKGWKSSGFEKDTNERILEEHKSSMTDGSGLKNDTYDQDITFTAVLCGNTSEVCFRHDNILLGPEKPVLNNAHFSLIVRKLRMVSNRNLSVINMLCLQEEKLYWDQIADQLIKENKIHAFIFVLPLGQLTDSDKIGLEWLQSRFGEGVLPYVMILFTYEREEDCDTIIDDLKNNSVLEELLMKCGDRYHTCSKSMNNQSEMRTLLEKIDHLVSENNQQYYTLTMKGKQNIKNDALQQQFSSASGRKRLQHSTHSHREASSPVPHQPAFNSSQNEEVDVTQGQTKPNEKPKTAINPADEADAVRDLFQRLHLQGKEQQKIKPGDVLQVSVKSLQYKEPCKYLAFLHKLMVMNYRAKYMSADVQGSIQPCSEEVGQNLMAFLNTESLNDASNTYPIHPMDVQMAVLHCSDSFLKQLIVTKLSQCQYALPLLVPDPFTREIEFPLWTFRQIKKSWKTMDASGKETTLTKPVYSAETAMVAFFRLDSVSSSKSQLMNSLINEKHNTFFHRHCPGSSRTRLLMDGVVEIAWYLPSGKSTDHFPECVAFCNLHGDVGKNAKQLEILTEMSSVNVVLLGDQQHISTNKEILQRLFNGPKPLICLLSDNNSSVAGSTSLKFKIGLKDRSQATVSEELINTINTCLSKQGSTFRLEDVGKYRGIKTDENDPECQKGKEAALQITRLLEGMEMSRIKETFLPCQGNLWHMWCQKNKDKYKLCCNDTENQMSKIQGEMNQIRLQQHQCVDTPIVWQFIQNLISHIPLSNETCYFLKWTEILLDKYTDGCFGLADILRETGQKYESSICLQMGQKVLHLPKLAARFMMSGHSVELMDGDAGHVPLVWVSAVLDELIKILGDQRVFVLSVLGIQSSGKSTMLNAMFGLQFAVSAGRCTRGAFMQLVKVSEEMKAELKFDYILVVDTEGLRALELAGKATIHHDNELATFVVGIANMTLINIFGENPVEIQDILQIVIQAFLRMMKVRLNPSCMFVHQNIPDVTAKEKTKESRRCLQEKLDEMTKLAALQEVCDAERFGDVIEFDVERDVRYFAQLWEGSPPMAPPNPSYSENIEELKQTIISKAAKKGGMKLSEFQTRIKDLWEALLNENFVFSFRNTWEISVYRKLEKNFWKWTWSLRKDMLEIQDKLQTRIINNQLQKIEHNDLVGKMKESFEKVNSSVKSYFEHDAEEQDILVQWRGRVQQKIENLHDDLIKQTKRHLNDIISQKIACKHLEEQKTQYEAQLFKRSKDLALTLKSKANNERELRRHFDCMWRQWFFDLTAGTKPLNEINTEQDALKILSELYEEQLVLHQFVKHGEEPRNVKTFTRISTIGDYTEYVNLNKKSVNRLTSEDHNSIRQLTHRIMQKTDELSKSKSVAKMGYKSFYLQEIAQLVKKAVSEHTQSNSKYKFKPKFIVDLSLHVCMHAAEMFAAQHRTFRESNDPFIYLEKKKSEYYNVFEKSCKGATSVAVFGGIICSELKEAIMQSFYISTASHLADEMRMNITAFNGNKSNLEKHILKSLAEEEDFEKFMDYILNPEEQFKTFIRDVVKKYMIEKDPRSLDKIRQGIKHKQECIISAAMSATEDVVKERGDANMWLKTFSHALKDELECNIDHLRDNNCQDVVDFHLLTDVVKKEIPLISEELTKNINRLSDLKSDLFRKKPEDILIEHFCRCCWVQCPFCRAICINTMEDHDGDHSVHFHRCYGVTGCHFNDTDYLCIKFCTTSVASDGYFYPTFDSDKRVPWKQYRTAGPEFAKWSISPDLSELPYWKWFVCRFQRNLEEFYKKTFQGRGEIPSEWRKYSKEDAMDSLDKCI
ncbi:interferon-induced very large GTPase 1-like [Brachyhypopomus gauderio]|uniref:interferon-induced very large GTPase 1-like n=1 Tax=Brachyhypopomus gauderio TaxID=698409 RepID=UPI0040429815